MIFSLGSINADMVIYSNKFPVTGETLIGNTFFLNQGGKGANQAVAAVKAGAPTTFIGRVGQDYFGKYVVAEMNNYGLNSRIIEDQNTTTGVAMINVDGQGNNKIIIIKGANDKVGSDELTLLQELSSADDILLIQGEIPLTTLVLACKIALENKLITIFDPAPVNNDLKYVIPYVDYLTPNEIEIQRLTGCRSLTRGMKKLQELGAEKIISKQGDRGLYYMDKSEEFSLPAFKVNTRDTTGAGDTFNGSFAASLSMGFSLKKSLQFAMAAAAIAVTRLGAAISSPTLQEINIFLEEQNEKNDY